MSEQRAGRDWTQIVEFLLEVQDIEKNVQKKVQYVDFWLQATREGVELLDHLLGSNNSMKMNGDSREGKNG